MATKVYGILETNLGQRFARLGMNVDRHLHKLFQKSLQGQITKEQYYKIYFLWFGHLEEFQTVCGELWKKFVKGKDKEEYDVKVSFKRGKRDKHKARRTKPFVMKTDIGVAYIRQALVLDNLQVLLTRLALSNNIKFERAQEENIKFRELIKKLEDQTVEVEKVESNAQVA